MLWKRSFNYNHVKERPKKRSQVWKWNLQAAPLTAKNPQGGAKFLLKKSILESPKIALCLILFSFSKVGRTFFFSRSWLLSWSFLPQTSFAKKLCSRIKINSSNFAPAVQTLTFNHVVDFIDSLNVKNLRKPKRKSYLFHFVSKESRR